MSSPISAFQYGVQGIQKGLNDLKRDAAEIASAAQFDHETSDPVAIAEPLANLITDRLQVAASAKIIEATDDVIGSLLDVKA
jgi:flagellar hook protein FlgE